ncbi:MAG: hypothetical protein HY365_02315 [Candidatus Aenigmarchaeota archaeon]|nr:hypothetical protein [Candidatus Aenigmarchaeota archaeon]
MGIFDSIKERIMGRRSEEDIDDIKSYVAGDNYDEKFRSLSQPEAPQKPWERAPLYEAPAEEVPALSVAQPAVRAQEEPRYEIMDRLKFIESQLSAIRSQTETINERLKNMEMRTGRY